MRLIVILTAFYQIHALSVKEVKDLFQSQECIPGNLDALTLAITDMKMMEKVQDSQNVIVPFINLTSAKENIGISDKSATTRIHELAQYHELEYAYKLVKEEGPAHRKIFTVNLILGEEHFEGISSSLKKAQIAAAISALEYTGYEHPPLKLKTEGNLAPLTPTVLLNNIAAKLGLAVTYYLIDKNEEALITKFTVYDKKPMKPYLERLNDSIYDDDSALKIKRQESVLVGPFTVKVNVGENSYTGFAHTIQAAKHDAAKNAIEGMKREVLDKNNVCMMEGSEQECKKAKDSLKSPISLVHEAAHLRNMEAVFEIVGATGPAHKKHFVTQCRLGHLTTEGEGKSKKESKKAAAEKMVARFSELPEVADEKVIVNGLKTNKRKKKKGNKHFIKSASKDLAGIVSSAFDSIMAFGSELGNKGGGQNEVSKDAGNNDNTAGSTNVKNSDHHSKSPQDQILEISNKLKFEIHFIDLEPENDQHLSVLSLDIKPSHICYGEGISDKDSRNEAAQAGVNLLRKSGLLYSLKLKIKEIERGEPNEAEVANENRIPADDNIRLVINSRETKSKMIHNLQMIGMFSFKTKVQPNYVLKKSEFWLLFDTGTSSVAVIYKVESRKA